MTPMNSSASIFLPVMPSYMTSFPLCLKPFLTRASLMASSLSPLKGVPSDRKSTRLNSSHGYISYAVFCLKQNDEETVRRRNFTHQISDFFAAHAGPGL